MFLFISILVVIVVIISAIIMAGNVNTRVDVNLLGRIIESTSLTLVMIYSFIVGVVFAIIIAIVGEVRLRKLLRSKERDVKRLTEELGAIRNLPLEEEKSETEREGNI